MQMYASLMMSYVITRGMTCDENEEQSMKIWIQTNYMYNRTYTIKLFIYELEARINSNPKGQA